VFPVVLGSGRRLFGEAPLSRFAVASSQPVGPDGVIVLTYVRAWRATRRQTRARDTRASMAMAPIASVNGPFPTSEEPTVGAAFAA